MDDTAKPPARECPFCREIIRADAIKCRFCASSLLEAAAESKAKDDDPDHVTYTFDKDTIRFTKVAVTLITAIVVVFGSLTGWDLKHAASSADESAKKARESSDSIDKLRSGVDDNQKKIDELQAAVDSKLRVIDDDLAKIHEGAEAAKHLIDRDVKIESISTSVDAFFQTSGTGAASVAKQSFTVPELARLYNFPTGLRGEGQNIALIELGGAYNMAGLNSYFGLLKLPIPKVDMVSVDGAVYKSEDTTGADSQVEMDIEVTGAVAPGAQITVYFAPNTDSGLLTPSRKPQPSQVTLLPFYLSTGAARRALGQKPRPSRSIKRCTMPPTGASPSYAARGVMERQVRGWRQQSTSPLPVHGYLRSAAPLSRPLQIKS